MSTNNAYKGVKGAGPLAGGSKGGQERIEPGSAAPSWSDKEAEPPLSFSCYLQVLKPTTMLEPLFLPM